MLNSLRYRHHCILKLQTVLNHNINYEKIKRRHHESSALRSFLARDLASGRKNVMSMRALFRPGPSCSKAG